MPKYTEWLTIKQAAELCEVHKTRITYICHNGWRNGRRKMMFRTERMGNQIIIHPADVDAFRVSAREVGNPNLPEHADSAAGGIARAEKLSPQRRSEISALGAKAKRAKKYLKKL